MQYDNTNSGALFANKEKRDEKDPNARGTINAGGVDYWVSAWTQTSKAGERYQKLKLTPKEERAAKPEKAAPPADDINDEIPF
jgi:hypothetical protein